MEKKTPVDDATLARAVTFREAGLEPIVPERPADAPWPQPIGPEARIGIAGAVLEALEPLTEADPNALLAQLLAGAGSLLGSGPHLLIGEKRHALRIWPLVVGSTASGKKGTGARLVLSLLDEVDPTWEACRKSGIASGEAIVHHVRDDTERVKRVHETGGAVLETRSAIEGVRDKRLLLLEEEFSRVLRVSKKDTSTLSSTLREAWDSDLLMTTAKTAPERATGAHVTVIGHITPEELRRELTQAEVSNGFANRFLFVLSRRSKRLAFPPRLEPGLRARLVEELRSVQRHWAGAVPTGAEIQLSPGARDAWETLKPEVELEAEEADDSGLAIGKIITRGAPYVLRLAALYAALARSSAVEEQHLRAAREVWRYSVDSARVIFGEESSHPDLGRVLDALEEAKDRMLPRSRIHEILHHHCSAADLTRLRDRLIASGKIEAYTEEANGRRGTEWWCFKQELTTNALSTLTIGSRAHSNTGVDDPKLQGGSMRLPKVSLPEVSSGFSPLVALMAFLGVVIAGRLGGAPGDWTLVDIGDPPVTADSTFSDGCFAVKTQGGALGGKADSASFIFREAEGDVGIEARFDSLEIALAKGGQHVSVQLRESLEPSSPFAASFIERGQFWRPNFGYRDRAGGFGEIEAKMEPALAIPNWPDPPLARLRIERRGQVFTAYYSRDGVRWTAMADHQAPAGLPAKLLAGVSLHAPEAELTSRVCDLTLDPPGRLLPRPVWTASPRGAVAGAEVIFDGTQSTPGVGKITRTLWQIDGGPEIEGETLRHVFTFGGSKLVTLAVEDESGRSVARTRILGVLPTPKEIGGWKVLDLSGAVESEVTLREGCFEVRSRGGHLPAPLDAAAFIYREQDGDLVLRARVSSVAGGGDAPSVLGLMVRESLGPEDRFVYVLLEKDTTVFKRAFAARLERGAREVWIAPPGEAAAVFPDVWLELRREGNDLVGSYSKDGTSWEEIARTAFPSSLPTKLLAGLAVTSKCGDSTFCAIPLDVTLCEVELGPATPPAGPIFRRGDADSSGHVNLTDAITLLNYLFKAGAALPCEDAADANDDGKLNLTDPIHIARYLFQSGPAPAPPGPEDCGVDPDASDALAGCLGECP